MSGTPPTESSKHNDEQVGVSSPAVDLGSYLQEIKATDQLPAGQIQPVLMGLFGEVGGILAILKKHVRERGSYPEFEDAVEEEFGDALWYFAALSRRLNIPMDSVVAAVPTCPDKCDGELGAPLLELGAATAGLLRINGPDTSAEGLLREFWGRYIAALQAADIDLHTVATRNLSKASGRFLKPEISSLPTFDAACPPYERLPDNFEITILQRPSGQAYMRWNGVFIGAPLTDNIAEGDDYRYHDVFHLAHAAILHWSPTFRSVIQHKRKTQPKIDEDQDGGRAIVVEEGLTAWIFSRAKELAYFEGKSKLSFDLLKTVEQFVRGYEVEQCPLNLWEEAILRGYEVFRQVRSNCGGVIVGDRGARTLNYRPLTADRV